MVADLPKYVASGTMKAKMICYADDSTVYQMAKSNELLIEMMSKKMIKYCNDNGLIINSAKIKLLMSSRDNFDITAGDSIVHADPEICLLGTDNDTNFSRLLYLRKLATEAKSRSNVIYSRVFNKRTSIC